MRYISYEVRHNFRQMCTNCTGRFDEKKYRWLCNDYLYGQSFEEENSEEEQSEKKNSSEEFEWRENLSDSERQKETQKRAIKFMIDNFSREERLLIMFQQDAQKYLSCFSSNKFKSESARQMVVGELSETFRFLRKKMVEFRWNAKFLKANGIDFNSLRNLYFQLCVS